MGHDVVISGIIATLGIVYGHIWVPIALAVVMVAWAIFVIGQGWYRTSPYLSAADARLAVLRKALGGDGDVDAQRASFYEHFPEVNRAMGVGGPREEALVQAWREFHEQIIDETVSPIRNTSRPNAFFKQAQPRQTALVFWSNIAVGAGLILTFLGLIYALAVAAKGMGASGSDIAQAQTSLIALLVAAAAKFSTSVGGLFASLSLRFGEHELTKRAVKRTDDICTLLERGLLHVPPQKLAAEQLDELKIHSKELKSFNTDLALQIGERFAHAITPVTESLATLNSGMAAMGEGLRAGLRGGAAEAISAAASGELRALGQTLNALREQLDGLGGHVGASGEDASRQIRAAGADFREAAENIRAAFDQLAGNVDGLGTRMAEQGEAAAQAQAESLERIVSGLEIAQGRSAAVMTEAVAALEGAGRNAANDLQESVAAALRQGVAESQKTFRHAVEESGEGLRSAAEDLSKAIDAAADRMLKAGEFFHEGGAGAAKASEAIAGTVDRAREASAALTDASRGLVAAATPVSQTAQAMSVAAERMTTAMQAGQEANAKALQSAEALASGLRETHGAAEQAWRDYRTRFEGVDKSLETATQKLADTLGDSMGQLRDFAHKVDGELASAVTKLAGSLDNIEDYAEALDEFVEAVRKPRTPETAE